VRGYFSLWRIAAGSLWPEADVGFPDCMTGKPTFDSAWWTDRRDHERSDVLLHRDGHTAEIGVDLQAYLLA
jgi:hypothetical protein